MNDTTKRDAVLREFMPCGGHVCKGCEVQCINVDGRTPSVKWMADEIVRLRDENGAFRAENDRLTRILAALREPSEQVKKAVGRDEFMRLFTGEWETIPVGYDLTAAMILAAVAAAEQEVGHE